MNKPRRPTHAKVRPLPPISDPNVDAALDLTDARVLTRSRDGDGSQPDDQFSSTNTSWSFSAIFGAAAVATGGYHLAMREADRFRGRWIPRWVGAERPTKRKGGNAVSLRIRLPKPRTEVAGRFSLPATFAFSTTGIARLMRSLTQGRGQLFPLV